MRFIKIFEKNPLKRIEAKAHSKNSKFRIRASRTSGINAAVHPLRGLTFNTKHGLRVSKTFKGLTLGFQGGNSVVRGRWSSENGLLNLNLSKSGFTLSSKSKYGTYNFSKPNRSSFKFAGIQLRGQKAAGPAAIFTLITLIPVLIQSVFSLIIFAFQVTSFLLKLTINICIIIFRVLQVAYDFALLIFIDIPKQIINNFFRKEIFDLIGETEVKIDKKKLLQDDKETIKNLKDRLKTYERTYADIQMPEKILKYFFAFLGLSLISIGLIIFSLFLFNFQVLALKEICIITLLALFFIGIGKLAIKPAMNIRRCKEDFEFKEILEL